jgi:hypothetical protein
MLIRLSPLPLIEAGTKADVAGGPDRVKLRRTQPEQMSSVLPLKADIMAEPTEVGFGLRLGCGLRRRIRPCLLARRGPCPTR